MLNLVRVELLKLRKRWMPWILIGVMVVILILTTWASYAEYHRLEEGVRYLETRPILSDKMAQVLAQQLALLEQARESLVLPTSIYGTFSMVHIVGAVLVVILTASVVGGEYGEGTVRQTLIKGVRRRDYVLSKVIALLLAVLVGLLIAALLGIILGLITDRVVSGGISWDFLSLSFIGHALGSLVGTWFALFVYLMFTAFVTFLARSTAAGVGVGLGYGLLEGIVVLATVGQIGGWFENIKPYTIGYNTGALVQIATDTASRFGFGGMVGGAGGDLPSLGRVMLVLAAYCAVFLGVSLYAFHKRDVPF